MSWLLINREAFSLVEIRELYGIDVFDIVDCVMKLVLEEMFLVWREERPFFHSADIR